MRKILDVKTIKSSLLAKAVAMGVVISMAVNYQAMAAVTDNIPGTSDSGKELVVAALNAKLTESGQLSEDAEIGEVLTTLENMTLGSDITADNPDWVSISTGYASSASGSWTTIYTNNTGHLILFRVNMTQKTTVSTAANIYSGYSATGVSLYLCSAYGYSNSIVIYTFLYPGEAFKAYHESNSTESFSNAKYLIIA